MSSGLDIASDLAATNLQTPEEALAQARGEAESASQEASDDRPAEGTRRRYGSRPGDGLPPSTPPTSHRG